MIGVGSGTDSDDGGWLDSVRSAARGAGAGLRASPAAVAAANEVGTSFGNALTEAAPSFAGGFEEAAIAARSWSWAAIAASVAVGVLGIGFVIWNIRKALA